ncbi:tryptophan 7-halogenase [Halioglobus maricola]|uniref:Tryptophan 7-halogenase n=1 Tax=Halioglobus maricola TaxID=2601894 RepID=A0A5P9NQY4_9GAMM|nr:tryptophan halogenase family protein [Halioglobus maricola]QFU77338.1 tryptophan 7-halogenase [Halioglobus maricola]
MTPTAINRIVIVGGGTAGWMAAASLSHFLRNRPTTVHLVEAPNVPTVGVGEATLPGIRNFNAQLGIDEVDFIRKTQASFKLGIRFQDWAREGVSFFHPFADYGTTLGGADFHQCVTQARNTGSSIDIGTYSLPTQLAEKGRFAQPNPEPQHPLLDYKYAFHFDALLYAAYLRDHAIANGVDHIQGLVTTVNQNSDSGYITSLALDNGATIEGDLFVDCSGFRGLLIEGALQTGYEDWSHWLPVDSAFAVGTKNVGEPAPYTLSTARKAGWTWRIPLQHRTGNGYVYSSKFCSDDEARQLLVDTVQGDMLAEPRKLSFTTGLRKKFWNKNCIALGLSSGFLEPLESTSISLIQTGLSKLLMFFPEHGFNDADIQEANRLARIEMERIRDFLILHYHPNQRSEGELWEYCRNMEIPTTLAEKIDLFQHRGHLVTRELESFQLASWVSIFDGMGIRPSTSNLAASELNPEELRATLSSMGENIAKLADGAPTHAEFISRHCAAPAE